MKRFIFLIMIGLCAQVIVAAPKDIFLILNRSHERIKITAVSVEEVPDEERSTDPKNLPDRTFHYFILVRGQVGRNWVLIKIPLAHERFRNSIAEQNSKGLLARIVASEMLAPGNTIVVRDNPLARDYLNHLSDEGLLEIQESDGVEEHGVSTMTPEKEIFYQIHGADVETPIIALPEHFVVVDQVGEQRLDGIIERAAETARGESPEAQRLGSAQTQLLAEMEIARVSRPHARDEAELFEASEVKAQLQKVFAASDFMPHLARFDFSPLEIGRLPSPGGGSSCSGSSE